jgi:hypothetical protein
VKIFLGGYPGAGKTTFSRWLQTQGWHCLDFDLTSPTRVLGLLKASADHPAFHHSPLVAEGGFLEEAPKFQEMFNRVGFTPIWLMGSKENLYASRRTRGDTESHLRADWINLVDTHRSKIQWRLEVDMWQGAVRKTGPQVLAEILREIEGNV